MSEYKKLPLPNESFVSQFERENQVQLPQEYRQFLMHHDGTKSGPYQMISKCGPRDESHYVIGTLLPLADRAEAGFENLQTFMDTYKKRKRIPDKMIPIASDPFGNLFLLGVRDPDIGKVFFWNHERELDANEVSGSEFNNTQTVAENFSEFLDSLRPLEERM